MGETEHLVEAVNQGDLDRVNAILNGNPSLVHAKDASGATALHHAAFHGCREVVRLLIERGADPNARDTEFGATPAGWAIEYLRELGGYLAVEFEDLAYAIRCGDARWVARFLRRFPALRDARYGDGPTFRELAAQSGHPEVASLFY
jgi:hypothetical protein